jgi:uncharacterized protein (DUF1697 family)
MAVNVALLRGINMGGHKKVSMSDLRALLTRLGFADAQSLLQSGNLVFRSNARPADLEHLLETEAGKRLGLQSDVFVRTSEEWREVVARNPFLAEAQKDPSHLVVMFLKKAPDAGSVRALRAAITGPEIIHSFERQAYIVYPANIGDSRLTISVIDRMLGTRATGRNWNTVLKISALAEARVAAH